MPHSLLQSRFIWVTLTFLCFLVSFFSHGIRSASAGTGDNITGHIWSSNVGWVSLNNCDELGSCGPVSYGISFLPVAPGTGSGYAWSPNVGWITFNDTGCPANVPGCVGGTRIDWEHTDGVGFHQMKGWPRACSVYVSGCSGALKDASILGGWDGYLALSDEVATDGIDWGAVDVRSDNTIQDWMWGSDVFGWMKFYAKINSGFFVTLTASSPTISPGQSSNLTWNSNGVSCTGTNFSTGSAKPRTGTVTVSPTVTTDYTVTCSDSIGNTKTATARVTVVSSSAVNNFTSSSSCLPPGNRVPAFSWSTTDLSQCTIKMQSSGNTASQSVLPSGNNVTLNSSMGIPASSASANYTLECAANGSGAVLPNLVSSVPPVSVSICATSYGISVTPMDPRLVDAANDPVTGLPRKKQQFRISVSPSGGFTGTVTLGRTLPSFAVGANPVFPSGTTAVFDASTLSSSAGSYGTAILTVFLPAASVTPNTTWANITVTGTSGSFSASAPATVSSAGKRELIYEEI